MMSQKQQYIGGIKNTKILDWLFIYVYDKKARTV